MIPGPGGSWTCGLHQQQGRDADALQPQGLPMFALLAEAARILG